MSKMDNCIFDDDTNNTIGRYKDLKAGLKEQAQEFLEGEDYEQVETMCEILLDLESYKESDSLLVLSENNGMGWTIKEYKKGV